MQGIKAWAQQNPAKLRAVLEHNPRYVFFREQPPGLDGPLGAQGVPLTPRRSIAADPHFVPLGAPVFLATTWPLSNRPLHQLMLAQDTGSAIRGAVRADFFWGYGDEAGSEAGRMKQRLRMWVLLPRGYPLNGLE
jgi:membrane-bound lytic murein transglycosylase A